MDREIKFRAWDARRKTMFVPKKLEWSETGLHFWNEFSQWDEDMVLMQFTGLLDKDGKEIFEGDVVRFVGGTTSSLRCGNYADERHAEGAVLIAKRLPSGFTLQMPRHLKDDTPNMVGNVTNYDFWSYARSLEIIGNIHENPELLK